jgi:hypothetical protein
MGWHVGGIKVKRNEQFLSEKQKRKGVWNTQV